MAGTEFSILAKVKLQADDIQRQLDDLSRNHEVNLHADTQDFELSLSVANAVMREFIELADKMIQQVYELDASLVEFRKVSDLRGEELNAYVEQLGEIGKTVGRTTSSMVDAAQMFRKSGFGDEEAAELARVASMFQNVADTEIDAASAAASIVSQLQAFGRDVMEPIHVIDSYNAVANNFAVGTNDLSRAMELSAAGMATYGNTFEEVIGLVTAGSEIMQGRSAQVARGLNTISANIVANKDALAAYGIEVEDVADGSLKATFDVLSELKPLWDTMTDSERQALGVTLAGKNQYRVLASVMTNFQHAIEATETALNSEGSAMRENVAFMEGLEARSNLLSATFQNLANDVIPKQLVANGLNVLNKALEILDTDLGVIFTRITLLTGIGWGMSSLLNASGFLSAVVSQFKTFAGVITGTSTAFAGFQSIALPVIGILALLGTTIYEVARKIKENKARLDELVSSANNFNTAIKEVNKNATEEKAKIEATTSATEIYIKRIEELDSKTQLTNAEQIEYHSLLQKIIDIMPSLASSIDLQNNKIIGGTTALREQIEAWKDLAKQQAYQTQMSDLYMTQAQIEYQIAENQIKLQEAQAKVETAKLMPEGRTRSVMGAAYMNERELAIASALTEVAELEHAIDVLEQQRRESNREIANAERVLSEIFGAPQKGMAERVVSEIFGVAQGMIDYLGEYIILGEKEPDETVETGISYASDVISPIEEQTEKIEEQTEKIAFNLQDFISLSNSEIDLLESEYSLMEAQGVSSEELNAKIKEIQDAYHEEAEILRTIISDAEKYNLTQEEINDIQTEINNRSIEWLNWKKKIKQEAEEILYDYQSIADEYQKIVDAHAEELQQQKNALTALQERMSDYYQEQIDDIDNQIDALREANDEIENQISLQEKLDALARAKQSKVLVYSNGGWRYLSDADAVSAATKDIESFKRTQALEENIAGLEAQKTVLQEVQNSWRNMSQDYDRIQNDWLINQQLGIDTTRDNWQTLVADAQTYATQYLAIMSAISEISGLSISGLAYDPNIDYHALMLSSKTYEEAMKWGAYRDAKIIGEGIVPDKTTQQILNEWTSGKVSSLNSSNSNRAASLIQNAHSFATNKDAISLAQKMGLIPMGLKGLPSISNVGQKVTNMTVQSLNLPNVTNVQQFVDYVKDNMFAKTLQFVH